ncbi:MAG TPA: hypothetical protein VEQ40_04015 [Pyrinomonadaceae bacterium]|nr:hypothetical protein [Pyrinomonadaceae bacterium]
MRKLGMTAISFVILLLFSSIGFSQSFINPSCTAPGSIMSVTNTSTGNFELVTFRIRRPPQSNYSYTVASVIGPTFVEDPSGNTITVNGNRFKRIRLKGIYWKCAITENITVPKIAVRDVKRIKQYEGIVEYVVGYKYNWQYLTTYTFNSSSTVRQVVMKFRKY